MQRDRWRGRGEREKERRKEREDGVVFMATHVVSF